MRTKNLFQSIQFYIVLFLAVILGLVCFAFAKYRPCTTHFTSFEESKDVVANPGMGFYCLHAFSLTENADVDLFFEYAQEETDTGLVLLEVNLKEYRSCDIPKAALLQLDKLFARYQEHNQTLILRFVYDWEARALETEPSSISQILTHMEQVAPIVNKYESLIYILQGSFTGDYGEMHDSNYSSAEELSLLMGKLQEIISPSVYLSVRTLAQLDQLTCDTTRIGLFNDGLLGSETDYGSYPEKERDACIQRQNMLCNTVPNGGEVIIDNSFNDIENAVSDLSAMHVSYLNSMYDQTVLQKWANSTYLGENGLSYISRHLGYRYVINKATLSYNAFSGEDAILSVQLENTGWASCYRDCILTLQLVSADGTKTEYPFKGSAAFLPSGELTIHSVAIPLRNYEDGTYSVYLTLTDELTKQALQFANATDTPTCLFLGEITLE